MSRRRATLELAVLGLLQQQPLHGYELRKRLNAMLGAFRALSYGTLYPCLRTLVDRGWITVSAESAEGAARRGAHAGTSGTSGTSAGRDRIVYELTAEGKDQFYEMVGQAGPAAWEDGSFDVHFAFFAQTESTIRLRILEGRRSRLEERLDDFRSTAARARERADAYTSELRRHGLESTEREVRWLNELIATEHRTNASDSGSAAAGFNPVDHQPDSTSTSTGSTSTGSTSAGTSTAHTKQE